MQTKPPEPNRIAESNLLKADLAVYNIHYNLPNFAQFSKQEEAFQKLASLCNEKRIALMVVAMPITAENRSLIVHRILQRYEKMIPQLAK